MILLNEVPPESHALSGGIFYQWRSVQYGDALEKMRKPSDPEFPVKI
jgi:hypothetical protein